MVLASFAEGLPVVMMEALALGRPVIGTYIAGIPELIEQEDCGWLVSAGAVDDLAETMKKALAMPVEKLQQMALVGTAKVRQEHNITIEAQKLASLLRASQTKTELADITATASMPDVTAIAIPSATNS